MRVAIIGAGLGGLAAAVKLRQRTAADFVIFEQAAGIGGTWRDNTYPGCEVDIHSHAYSYSFLDYEWPRTHATQPELLAYAEHVAEVFGLTPHLRLNTRVTSLIWEESAACYALSTEDGERHEFDVVISATGLFSAPRYPDWPGLGSFTGACFHTARWEPEHDLSGKTVAVVGTGSTSAQVVPAIAPRVVRARAPWPCWYPPVTPGRWPARGYPKPTWRPRSGPVRRSRSSGSLRPRTRTPRMSSSCTTGASTLSRDLSRST